MVSLLKVLRARAERKTKNNINMRKRQSIRNKWNFQVSKKTFPLYNITRANATILKIPQPLYVVVL